MPQDLEAIVARARAGEKYAIGRLISHFEDTRASAATSRARILELLEQSAKQEGLHRTGRFFGLTGTPGAGKSSLIGQVARRLLHGEGGHSVAVLAVDPSSHVSGGAILGDRTRVNFPLDEKRLFFRSQASDRELGGVSRTTFQVCRLLMHLFDFVLVETVGIGQSEIEIQHMADRVYLVLQPLAGDQIQFMKAGIMEIPDVFILNKADEVDAARKSEYALRASLAFARPDAAEDIPILLTSAHTGLGLDELARDMRAALAAHPRLSLEEKEVYYFEKWVRDEYGRTGLHRLNSAMDGAQAFLRNNGGFDAAQIAFASGAADAART